MFQLHATLAKDTFYVGEFPLSTCRLMNDCQFPWLILVPRIAGVNSAQMTKCSFYVNPVGYLANLLRHLGRTK